eukprot:gene10510-10669_t
MLQHAVQAFLIAAVLSPFSYYAGQAAKRLGLPQITGYVVSGIICGPYVLGILSQESLTDLSIIEGACLGIIGLAAGAELHLSELNRSKKQVVTLTAGICCFTWLFCYVGIAGSAALTPVLPHMSPGLLAAVASLGGTLMMARSPASAIAVLKEMEAKGPFVALVMGVVVLKDVVVIVLFAINLQLVPMIISSSSASLGVHQLLLPLLSVAVALSAGLMGGYLMHLSLKHQLQNKLVALVVGRTRGAAPGMAPQGQLNARAKQLILLLLSTCVFNLTRWLDAEPLLACVTAGMLLANIRAAGGGEQPYQEDLAALINGIMQVTNVAFFGLAGASLKLAGVAMGLARIAGTAFPEWGPAFQTVMMAIIMINMLVGPPLFRLALIQVGEARAHSLPAAGHHLQQLHRDQSLAPPAVAPLADQDAKAQPDALGVRVNLIKQGSGSSKGSGWVAAPEGAVHTKSEGKAATAALSAVPGVTPRAVGGGRGALNKVDEAQEPAQQHVVVNSATLLRSLAGGWSGHDATD